ncbi:MAG: SDR family oxidoreductase [Anaerolineae bacterium]|nr:SDR family oxidoreductase [Anaerolineae bacterium]
MTTRGNSQIDLSGQVAIVTGGGRGLGKHMGQALAAAGAAVALVGRSEAHVHEAADLIRQSGGRAMAITANVADAAAVEQMANRVEDELGPVDILVNNAGVVGTPGPIWQADPEEFRKVLDINVFGAFICARYILPGMVQRHRGRIINVASGAALSPIPFGHSYCVSKAALLRLTECMAVDTQEHGISIFAIDPGTVRTDMAQYLIDSEAGQTYLPWFRKFVVEEQGDVPAALSATLVIRLASGIADPLTGRMISVADDLDQLVAQHEQITESDLYTLRLRRLAD